MFAAGAQELHQHQQGQLCGISTHNKINSRVTDQLFVKIGGRKTSEDDRAIGMEAFDDAGDFDRPVGVRQPVQVNAESHRVQLFNVVLHVKMGVIQHAYRKVDDAGLQAGPFQV